MCLTEITLDCKKKTSTSPTHRERPLIIIKKTGCGTTERNRGRWTARERDREDVGLLYEMEDKSLIDQC